MEEFINIQKYFNLLGHFWQNFNNLEYFLRLYLYNKNGGNNISAQKFMSFSEGSICDENFITDYKSFGQLFTSFNSYQEAEKKIEYKDILNLRDALVHGRVTQDLTGNEWNLFVIKYSKPKDGKVTVEYKREISSSDFEKIVNELGSLALEVSLRMGARVIS